MDAFPRAGTEAGYRDDGVRVADVAASKRFYAGIAPAIGHRLRSEAPGRVQFRGRDGSFSLVAGTPTESAHMGFAGTERRELRDPDGNAVELGV